MRGLIAVALVMALGCGILGCGGTATPSAPPTKADPTGTEGGRLPPKPPPTPG